jgi:hypothetical protein
MTEQAANAPQPQAALPDAAVRALQGLRVLDIGQWPGPSGRRSWPTSEPR